MLQALALFLSELETLNKKVPGFTLIVWDGTRKGRFNIRNLLVDPGAAITYYICGPIPMIASFKQALKQQGVKPSVVYAEEFKLY